MTGTEQVAAVAPGFFSVLPDLTPTVVSLLMLGLGFWVFLREIKERETNMRQLEKEVRDNILGQLQENTKALTQSSHIIARIADKLADR